MRRMVVSEKPLRLSIYRNIVVSQAADTDKGIFDGSTPQLSAMQS